MTSPDIRTQLQIPVCMTNKLASPVFTNHVIENPLAMVPLIGFDTDKNESPLDKLKSMFSIFLSD